MRKRKYNINMGEKNKKGTNRYRVERKIMEKELQLEREKNCFSQRSKRIFKKIKIYVKKY